MKMFCNVTRGKKIESQHRVYAVVLDEDRKIINDTVIGNKKCIGETINLGTGYDFTIEDTLKRIQKLTNNIYVDILNSRNIF